MYTSKFSDISYYDAILERGESYNAIIFRVIDIVDVFFWEIGCGVGIVERYWYLRVRDFTIVAKVYGIIAWTGEYLRLPGKQTMRTAYTRWAYNLKFIG